jgi:MFS family permease
MGRTNCGESLGLFCEHDILDSRQSWLRLMVTLVLMTIGASGMYIVSVILPSVEKDFGISRGMASLPYALTMIGFGLGGIVVGKISDRIGVAIPLAIASVCLGAGYIIAGFAPHFWVFALAQGLFIGFLGCSATFSPLLAETSFWFEKRRGIAVAICASGNYLGGAIWPPIAQYFIEQHGWRNTYIAIGIFCTLTMVPLALWLQRSTPTSMQLRRAAQSQSQQTSSSTVAASIANGSDQALGMHPKALLLLLSTAGVGCCVAMSMPQVHIVAMCHDLGYGVTRGAQMLSTMLAFGIISRLVMGFVCDRIGGLRTLMLGSALQTIALLMFLPADSMSSLFIVSALFGLFQGGIVPSYAIIVRELFSPRLAGAYVGTVLMATMMGMALGGWLSGKIFDWTGSYQAAFMNGIAWNLLNLAIVIFLYRRSRISLKLRQQTI